MWLLRDVILQVVKCVQCKWIKGIHRVFTPWTKLHLSKAAADYRQWRCDSNIVIEATVTVDFCHCCITVVVMKQRNDHSYVFDLQIEELKDFEEYHEGFSFHNFLKYPRLDSYWYFRPFGCNMNAGFSHFRFFDPHFVWEWEVKIREWRITSAWLYSVDNSLVRSCE